MADHGGWSGLLGPLTDGVDLTRPQAEAAMTEILAGQATDAQIAGLLVGLKAKGETVQELTGFATAMADAAEPLSVDRRAIDIVGTGGSGHRRRHALNVSTMASIVAASAGAIVCKHGNRRASSTSGSFDFLEALGVAIELDPRQLERCVEEVGLGFAFARSFHPAMRFAGPVRAELGIPTVFNLLGPLANPARVTRQVVGVSSPERAEAMAEVLLSLGSESAWVVSGADGLDELSTTGDSVVYRVARDGITPDRVALGPLGIAEATLGDLAGGSAEQNVAIFNRILAGESGPHRDIVVLNAGAGLVVAGESAAIEDGVDLAVSAIESGRAGAKLEQLVETTNRLISAQ
ncbi:MAG: anthranilate phosphoribosyltransferase [Acidimicrobiales bacterium]